MDPPENAFEIVDPIVRAHVDSLVIALGGSSADEQGRYELGDDALACLRDIKRWLKIHDERNNRLDVARCLAESNIVGGDILHILSQWPEHETDNKMKYKIALACLELLVPLTWPIDKHREMTNNLLRHTPYLELAQLKYKRDIINWDRTQILKTAVRLALPPMAIDLKDRSTRDQGIIKLVLYFIRNIAIITPPPANANESDEAEISQSPTIDAFDYQDVFTFLLPISSGMGDDFNTEDVVVMEILFHLLKGVDIEKLFMNERQLELKKGDDLADLRRQEASLLREYQRTAPTRHNRFGTMVWVKGEDNRMAVVSGQDALIDTSKALAKMDSSKKFRPPRRGKKDNEGPLEFDVPVSLTHRANNNLRSFVEEFLDAGFNPLFQHIRKAIDREAERVQEHHHRQFFYLVSWFLEAERVRRKNDLTKKTKSTTSSESDGFGLVAGVLNQEMFITLNRVMEISYESKSWHDLNAAMRCFTQILLTVQEMSDSPLEEDQEIAENILSRIFYEETTHDRVANIVRTYKDQGFGYLDACTELAHVYMRTLEAYSKQNPELQVRSKRRTRRKKKAAKVATESNDAESDGSDNEDLASAIRTNNERKFDFNRFANRFLSQGAVDTFVSFLRYHNDLKPEQLKRCHRYLFRVAFKMEMSVMLFRVDVLHLLHKLIKGPGGLDPKLACFREWDDLVMQLIRRCTKKMLQRPELIVEMLFSKTNATAHYLEYGYDKQTKSISKSRPAAEWEVKGERSWEEQVAIVVSALLDRNEGDLLEWIKDVLTKAEVERRTWENANKAAASAEDMDDIERTDEPSADIQTSAAKAPSIPLTAPSEPIRLALFKNAPLRLLLTLLSFQNLSPNDDPQTSFIIPSFLSFTTLKTSLDLIKASEFSPPTFDDDATASDQLRRKPAARKKVAYDDDSDNDGGIIHDNVDSDDDLLFPAGGPTDMHTSKKSALASLKAKRARPKDNEGRKILLDAALEARNTARRQREAEKQRKIKSELYVVDSDDETLDQAFYEREARFREEMIANAGKDANERFLERIEMGRKRKVVGGFVDDDESEDGDGPDTVMRDSHTSSPRAAHNSDIDDEDHDNSTPPRKSSPPPSRKRQKKSSISDASSSINEEENRPAPSSSTRTKAPIVNISISDDEDDDEDEEDEEVLAAPTRRRRQVGAFIEDSDAE